MMRPYTPEAASGLTARAAGHVTLHGARLAGGGRLMMRTCALFALLLVFASACTHREVPPPTTRDAAWWWWKAPAAPQPGPRVPLVYVQAGTLDDIRGSAWPSAVPPAERYVLVWRSDRRAVPMPDTQQPLVTAYTRVRAAATAANARVTGMQVDADVPTASLRTFATWLDAVRRALPRGDTLSVTGLLDWFRDGTDVARVAGAVDELVPQFYDVEPRSATAGIAHPFDLAAWTTRLDALERPYRLGLATFGRIERIEERDGQVTRVALRDVTPLDLAQRMNRRPGELPTPGGERVVEYTAADEPPHRRYQLLIPPRDVVAAGERMAAACGHWCAGVAFFRWPSADESLVIGPATEAGDAHPTTVAPITSAPADTLVVEPAACVPLWCADVSLRERDPFPASDRIVRLRSTRPLAMVQARDPRGPVQVSPSTIDLRVPAYHGSARLALARIFTDEPARITLDPVLHGPPPLPSPVHR